MGRELASDFLPSSGTSVQVRQGLVRPRWAHLARGLLSTDRVLRRARVWQPLLQGLLTEMSHRCYPMVAGTLTLESDEP